MGKKEMMNLTVVTLCQYFGWRTEAIVSLQMEDINI